MKECLQLCCDSEERCDAAILNNAKCVAVDCSGHPSKCQTTSEGIKHDDNYQIAFIRKTGASFEGNILSADITTKSQSL